MYEINFIPGYTRERKIKNTKRVCTLISVLILILIIWGLIYIPLEILENLNTEKIKHINKVINNNVKFENLIENKFVMSEAIKNERVIISNNVENVMKYISNSISLGNININSGELNINGESKDYISIIRFSSSLGSSKKYGRVRIINIDFNKNIKQYSFLIKIEPRK